MTLDVKENAKTEEAITEATAAAEEEEKTKKLRKQMDLEIICKGTAKSEGATPDAVMVVVQGAGGQLV